MLYICSYRNFVTVYMRIVAMATINFGPLEVWLLFEGAAINLMLRRWRARVNAMTYCLYRGATYVYVRGSHGHYESDYEMDMNKINCGYYSRAAIIFLDQL